MWPFGDSCDHTYAEVDDYTERVPYFIDGRCVYDGDRLLYPTHEFDYTEKRCHHCGDETKTMVDKRVLFIDTATHETVIETDEDEANELLSEWRVVSVPSVA